MKRTRRRTSQKSRTRLVFGVGKDSAAAAAAVTVAVAAAVAAAAAVAVAVALLDLSNHHPFHNAARAAAVDSCSCCVPTFVLESVAASVSSADLVKQLRALLKRRRPIPILCASACYY